MCLDLPDSLERVLSSTNLIENLFSRVRNTARRVKHWQGGDSALDCGRRARSRGPLPQSRGLSKDTQAGHGIASS
jgi:hypothetical protein